MWGSAETRFRGEQSYLSIFIEIPLSEIEAHTNKPLVHEAEKLVRKYLTSERRRQKRHPKADEFFGSR